MLKNGGNNEKGKSKVMNSFKISNKTKGILFVIMAAFGFSMMSVFVRLAGDLPAFEKAFFRNIVALVFISGVIIKKKIGFMPDKRNLPFLFGRAIFGTIGLVANFYAIDHLVLADANMLNKLSPFFAIIFSAFILKEKPKVIQIVGTVTAFAGSALIIKPGLSNAAPFPALMGLIGGLGAGIAYTFVRLLGKRGEEGTRIIFFFSLFSTLVCVPIAFAEFEMMSLRQLIFLILAGVSACIGQVGITRAYLYAPAREISVYDYSQVVFAALFGFILFNQVPDWLSVLGYLLICGAGIGMFLYNRNTDNGHEAQKNGGLSK